MRLTIILRSAISVNTPAWIRVMCNSPGYEWGGSDWQVPEMCSIPHADECHRSVDQGHIKQKRTVQG